MTREGNLQRHRKESPSLAERGIMEAGIFEMFLRVEGVPEGIIMALVEINSAVKEPLTVKKLEKIFWIFGMVQSALEAKLPPENEHIWQSLYPKFLQCVKDPVGYIESRKKSSKS